MAYACLYKAKCEKTDIIKADDITISLVREGRPRELIKWFKRSGCSVDEAYPGIYYIAGEKVLFPTQIIVSSKVNPEEHEWLRSLTSKMDEAVGERLVMSANDLTDKDDKENADSVLQLALAENDRLFERLKEKRGMCEALRTLMKPEIDEAAANAKSEGKIEGRTEGATELATAVKKMKNGISSQKLLDEGCDPEIVKAAQDLFNELS